MSFQNFHIYPIISLLPVGLALNTPDADPTNRDSSETFVLAEDL
jgi:hypothetical protein